MSHHRVKKAGFVFIWNRTVCREEEKIQPKHLLLLVPVELCCPYLVRKIREMMRNCEGQV